MSAASAGAERPARAVSTLVAERVPRTSDYIASHAALHPERIAIEYFGDRISWQRLDTMLRKFTLMLARYGLEPGSRVCVATESRLHHLVILLACDNLGLPLGERCRWWWRTAWQVVGLPSSRNWPASPPMVRR